MRKILRLLVAALFYYSGVIALARRRMQQQGPRAIILNYHRASTGDLRKHMLYLRRFYRVMHLDDALQELYASAAQRPISHDVRTPVVLTFDDGYRDNYTHAFKYASDLHMPITIFLVPGYLESGDYFWWGEGKRLVEQTSVTTFVLDGRAYDLRRNNDRAELTAAIDTQLRNARSVAGRDAFLQRVRRELAVLYLDEVALPTKDANVPLSWAEVIKMQESGWVSYGAHTMHHPVLSCLVDPAEVHSEIAQSRTMLEARLGRIIRSFAYPIGRAEHIGEEAIRAVRQAGFSWAVTTRRGFALPDTDPYLIDRSLTDASRHWLLLAAEISGVWSLFAPLWKPFINEQKNI